ncbi:class I SAM-dependent methyltransferase [Caenimonas aquaedulcis]|uniref:Class I SAM-dependent methyltransferase n=1 Tax=Caenimonas aquaedulcis TaxID=2793270 RepID=A0A931H3A9_9BURK|nr:class I SAM-dependent methyltransferase [Caenimonas aquaedulcis]MBG9387747.1 class I SAM-dependent methyltransferase [Caenimonas aquaedulcis]
MRIVFFALLAALAGCASTPSQTPSPERFAALVAAPDRAAADRVTDVRRKPAETLAFIGVQPGWVALDVSAARGYTTELIARAVGPGGKVYAQSPPRRATPAPAPAQPEGASAPPAPNASTTPPAPTLAERAARPAGANIVIVSRPFEDPAPPEVSAGALDLVTLMFNYHDFGHMGVDRASVNRAVFKALKPGGVYVIADHSGRAGTGISEAGTLHRVEEDFVKREVEAAGFRLAARGDYMRNPADPRDRNTPEPPMPKDEFVLKFVKPAR